eukprot:6173639-Pleurochrysis_carterae.AAC.1
MCASARVLECGGEIALSARACSRGARPAFYVMQRLCSGSVQPLGAQAALLGSTACNRERRMQQTCDAAALASGRVLLPCANDKRLCHRRAV